MAENSDSTLPFAGPAESKFIALVHRPCFVRKISTTMGSPCLLTSSLRLRMCKFGQCEKVVGPNPTSPTACYDYRSASILSTADTFSNFRASAVSSLQRIELGPTESLGTRLGLRETMLPFDFVVVDVAPFHSRAEPLQFRQNPSFSVIVRPYL